MVASEDQTTQQREMHALAAEFKLLSLERQADNIREWTKRPGVKVAGPSSAATSPRQGDLSKARILTPHLTNTQETFLFLWSVIASRFAGDARLEPFSLDVDGAWPEELLILGIDEELPAEAVTWPEERFVHAGPSVLARPTNAVSLSTVDMLARFRPMPLDAQFLTTENAVQHPAFFREAATSPHVETLAFVAHHPEYLSQMFIDGTGLPWLWVHGAQFHRKTGTVTAQTPILARTSEDAVSLAGYWNDSGIGQASVPTFLEAPRSV